MQSVPFPLRRYQAKFLRLSLDAIPNAAPVTNLRLSALECLSLESRRFRILFQDRAIIPNPPSPMQYRRAKILMRAIPRPPARLPRQALLPSYLTIIASIQTKPEAQKS